MKPYTRKASVLCLIGSQQGAISTPGAVLKMAHYASDSDIERGATNSPEPTAAALFEWSDLLILDNMNAELVKKALEIVLNPNILVNLISRRVRQLNSGGGSVSRPLILDVGNLGLADIALREIIEGKMGWEVPEVIELTRPTGKNRKRPQNWAKEPAKPAQDVRAKREPALSLSHAQAA